MKTHNRVSKPVVKAPVGGNRCCDHRQVVEGRCVLAVVVLVLVPVIIGLEQLRFDLLAVVDNSSEAKQ